MGFPPAVPVQKAPEKKLSRPCSQLLKAPSREIERHDIWTFRRHFRDRDLVNEGSNDRLDESESYDGSKCSEVQCGPIICGHDVGNELVSRGNLMKPGKDDAGVRHQVDQIPR